MKWCGPYTVKEFENDRRPPREKSVYQFSFRLWESDPTKACTPL